MNKLLIGGLAVFGALQIYSLTVSGVHHVRRTLDSYIDERAKEIVWAEHQGRYDDFERLFPSKIGHTRRGGRYVK